MGPARRVLKRHRSGLSECLPVTEQRWGRRTARGQEPAGNGGRGGGGSWGAGPLGKLQSSGLILTASLTLPPPPTSPRASVSLLLESFSSPLSSLSPLFPSDSLPSPVHRHSLVNASRGPTFYTPSALNPGAGRAGSPPEDSGQRRGGGRRAAEKRLFLVSVVPGAEHPPRLVGVTLPT